MTIKSVGLSAMLWAVLSAAQVLARAPPAAPNPAKDEADGRAQIGERFYDLGLSFASGTHLSKSTFQESASLIEAATLMNPQEPRFLRLLARMREQQGDVDGAIAAWAKYRALPGLAEDEIAQIAMIDLFISQMQANDVKVAYLRDKILANANIGPRVKAHAAFRAGEQLTERSTSEARSMFARARSYYPLPEVTEAELNLLPAKATAAERMKALLAVLRSNPMRPDLIARVADMLADAGYSEDAVKWYTGMLEVHQSERTAPRLSSVINYLTERYRAGDASYAVDQLDNQILKGFPEYADAWFLRLTIARSNESALMLKQAEQAFLKRLDGVSTAISNGSSLPSTQPASSTATAPARPDIELAPLLATVGERAKQTQDPRSREALAGELSNLAWFELYFDHNAPAAEPVLKVLKELLPADNVTLNNLTGWYHLVKGEEQGARDIFTAQQQAEPLSALGLFRLEEQKDKNVEAAVIGVKIASHPRTGWIGAILWEAIKGRGFKPDEKSRETVAIKTELDTFPRDYLHVAKDPGRFYTIRVEPVKIEHRLGDPLLAVLTLENNCELDMTIGDYGMIKPTLVFDAQIKGEHAKSYPGIAIDRLMGKQVLAKNESISQVIRIDQAELSAALREQPANQLPIAAEVVTNMVPIGPSLFQPRAGGCVRWFDNGFVRTRVSMASIVDRLQFSEKMAQDTPADKIFDLELLAAYINQYVHSNPTKEEQELSQQYAVMIDKYRANPAPSVKAWASYIYANLLNGAQEQRAIGDMLQSQSWELRMLALVAARRNLPPEVTRQIAIRQAATDADPLVKAYAGAIVESLQTPATQPATIPSGGGK